jgi:Zn finger protein HypA/HybF involved in hydrogenase expression
MGNQRKIAFILKATEIHGGKYNYSQIDYKNTEHKVGIVCKIHGQFFQSPHSHIQGHGCPKCKDDRVRETHQKSIDDFLLTARKVHGNRYDYSRVDYKHCGEKVTIVCREHGEFSQTPSSHTNHKQGCPKCSLSKGEGEISLWLDNNQINYIHQSKFPDCRNPKTNYQLRFDFYIPSKNVLIEYDGPQHSIVDSRLAKYKFTRRDLNEIRYRDGLKSAYASAKGIRLLRINYLGKKDIRTVLQKELL